MLQTAEVERNSYKKHPMKTYFGSRLPAKSRVTSHFTNCLSKNLLELKTVFSLSVFKTSRSNE